MEHAKISVAMCTYNGSRFLPEQLKSLSAQTVQPHEVVICDDGSTDGTLEVLENFRQQCGIPVQIHRNSKQLGSTRNFEQAIRLCEGEIIALCDQDDRWMPEKMARLHACFEQDPALGGIFSDAALMDESGQGLQGTLWKRMGFTPKMRARFSGLEAVRTLTRKDIVTGCTLAFRGALKSTLLPIPESWVHDGWIALLLANVTSLLALPEPLVTYRLHAAQQIGATKTPLRVHLQTKPSAALAFHEQTSERFRAAAERLQVEDRQSSMVGAAGMAAIAARSTFHQQRALLLQSPRRQRFRPAAKLVKQYAAYEKGWLSLLRDLAHAEENVNS